MGKKQAQLSQATQLIPEKAIEKMVGEKTQGGQEAEKLLDSQERPKTLADSQTEKPASAQKQEPPDKLQQTQPSSPKRSYEQLYYIQIGAFQEKRNAEKTAENFRKKGYSTLVVFPLPSEKRKLYKVRIGGVKTRKEAEDLKADLEKSEKTQGFIVRQ